MACCKQMKTALASGEIDHYKKAWANGATICVGGVPFTKQDYESYLNRNGLCPFCHKMMVKEEVTETIPEHNQTEHIDKVLWACCIPYQTAYESGRIQKINGDLYLDEIHVLCGCPFCGKRFSR